MIVRIRADRARRLRRRVLAGALAASLACGMPDPEPLPRILGAAPEGEDVPTTAAAEIRFGAPVDPDGLLDGRLLVLVPIQALRAATNAVDSDSGAAGLAAAVPVDAAVEDRGERVVLRPVSALRAFSWYAIALSSRVRAADGRAMLDPDGRRRVFVSSFATGAPEGPPPAPALTEVRIRAATPESGGEYVEVLNLGEGPLDLAGWRLAKRNPTGTLSSCEIASPAGAVIEAGGVGLVAGRAWDGRYLLPDGVPVLACGATALLGGIANDRAPEILLADPGGAILATLGSAGAPVCRTALEKIDPAGADDPENLACTDGTPGVVPDVASPAD
jgi:hypothetical protein